MFVVFLLTLSMVGGIWLIVWLDDFQTPVPSLNELQQVSGVLVEARSGGRRSFSSLILQTSTGRERYWVLAAQISELRTALNQPVTVWIEHNRFRTQVYQVQQGARLLLDYAPIEANRRWWESNPWSDIGFGLVLLLSPMLLLREALWLRSPVDTLSWQRRSAVSVGSLFTILGTGLLAISVTIPAMLLLFAIPILTAGIGITEYAWNNYRGGIRTFSGAMLGYFAVILLVLLLGEAADQGITYFLIASLLAAVPGALGFFLLRAGHRMHCKRSQNRQ